MYNTDFTAPKCVAQKTISIVVKIISNLRKIISNVIKKRLLIILGVSNPLIIGGISVQKNIAFLDATFRLISKVILNQK